MKRNLLWTLAAASALTVMAACGTDNGNDGAEDIFLSASPAWIGFDLSNANGNVITVKSNSAWIAVPDEGLAIDKTSGKAGEESVRITHMEGDEVLTITFTTTEKNANGKNISKTVNVTNENTPPSKPIDPDSYWFKAADSATMELLKRYWPPLLSRVTAKEDVIANWHFAQRHDYKSDPNSNYWQQAHAMDAIVDAYNRTPATSEYASQKSLWLSIYDKWFQGVPKKQWMGSENWAATKWVTAYPHVKTGNAGGWRNEYIDDMAWMALTQIRMYESLLTDQPALAAKYLSQAKEIYDDYIWGWAWDATNKGLFWRMDVNSAGVPQTLSKNACSNGPAMIIAAKLAHYAANAEDKAKYLLQASEIYDWMISHLWKDTGAIADKWTGTASTGGALVYNQGTFIGGSHWLFRLTGEEKYLQTAVKATDYTINSLQLDASNGARILHSHCVSDPDNGNNSVFRAVFLRYFAEMINEKAVDNIAFGKRTGWIYNLKSWADYVWTDGVSIDKGDGVNQGVMLFSYDWRVMHPDSNISNPGVHLGNQISGAVLMESMNLIKIE